MPKNIFIESAQNLSEKEECQKSKNRRVNFKLYKENRNISSFVH